MSIKILIILLVFISNCQKETSRELRKNMKRDSDSLVLNAIEQNNMIFVSAQPDTTYFHWQVELYLYQFSKHGITDRCYALFGYKNTPSDYAKNLAKKYPGIKMYRDERTSDTYSPTIRPHILAKFFRDYPHLGKNVFYHDSDIFLVKLPRFDLMLQPYDSNAYLSDTMSYIGYDYIKGCSVKYKKKHTQIRDLDIFYGMCEKVGIDPALVQKNQINSGGAQYLLKNIDYAFWEKCEKGCDNLYNYLCEYEKKYPINDHIQKWTADMWVVLWYYWRDIGPTMIHKELDFSWATGTVREYNALNIFHLAGVTSNNSSDKFQKGHYTKQIVFDAFCQNPKIFDHINKDNATYEYVKVIKEYTRNIYIPERHLTSAEHLSAETPTNKPITKIINYKDPRTMRQIIERSEKSIKSIQSKPPLQPIQFGKAIQPLKQSIQSVQSIQPVQAAQAIQESQSAQAAQAAQAAQEIQSNKHVQNTRLTQPQSFKSNQKRFQEQILLHKRQLQQAKLQQTPPIPIQSHSQNRSLPGKLVKKFKINTNEMYGGVYDLSTDRICCGKNIWRSSDKKFIIFWTGKHWVLTFSQYEQQLGTQCGGIISTSSNVPYTSNWNVRGLSVNILQD